MPGLPAHRLTTPGVAMLPNGPDVQFIADRGVAAPHKEGENCADGPFFSIALLGQFKHAPVLSHYVYKISRSQIPLG